MLAGVNGVGKTTFLRLMPLFYGASPSQILRGQGHVALIRHTLPDPSSAVAYEYERESADDLRCVVMHAHPDSDVPEFSIIKGAYQEAFFMDANGGFVRREDFKAHVEGMGFRVERKLGLSEWRDVILNQRANTKEGQRTRELAALHSLGPKSLHGLEQIAAAMANEKLSFKDLQNVVLDRVQEGQEAETPVKRTTKEFRQNIKEVKLWLEARDHLAKLLAKKGDALRLKEQCSGISMLVQGLVEMRHYALETQRATQTRLDELRLEEPVLLAAIKSELADIDDRIGSLRAAHHKAKVLWEDVCERVKAIQNKVESFTSLGIEHLAREQTEEQALKAEFKEVTRQLDSLLESAQGLETTHINRLAVIASQAADEKLRISAELSASKATALTRAGVLRLEEQAALDGLVAPVRLQEMPSLMQAAAERLGGLRADSKNPSASAETTLAAEQARARLGAARVEFKSASTAADTDKGAANDAQKSHLAALSRVTFLQQETSVARARLEDIVLQMTPVEGSLLAFLRTRPAGEWGAVAKVIDPALLQCVELAPSFDPSLDDDGLPPTGVIAVGPLRLDLQSISAPDWVDMEELRKRHRRAQDTVETALAAQVTGQAEAGKRQSEAEASQAKASQAGAHKGLAEKAVERAEAAVEELRACINREIESRAIELKKQIVTEEKCRDDLNAEDLLLKADAAGARQRISQGFTDQQSEVTSEAAAAQERLDHQLEATLERENDANVAAEEDYQRELTGAGIDPERVSNLGQRKDKLQERLGKIATNRHHVLAWDQFRTTDLVRLPAETETANCAEGELGAAGLLVSDSETERSDAVIRTAEKKRASADAMEQREKTLRQIQALLERGLKNFTGVSKDKLSHEWSVAELNQSVDEAQRKLAEMTFAANAGVRSLRGIMTGTPGPIDDWVLEAEKALFLDPNQRPDEEAAAKARILCDWFEGQEAQPLIALNNQLYGFMNKAGSFVRDLERFDKNIKAFNTQLQDGLSKITKFENFGSLVVEIRSSIDQLDYLKVLNEMRRHVDDRTPLSRSVGHFRLRDMEIPGEEVVSLVRRFRDQLEAAGGIQVNLAEQVLLEFRLKINGKDIVITNDNEFIARASNGIAALIVAMFLLGFASIVRRGSPVRLTWVADEIGKYDPSNLSALIQTLEDNQVDVIAAAPTADPVAIALFKRRCIFETSGAIRNFKRAEWQHD